MQKYLEAGKIINTHGVRGEIKIDSWCDTPQILAKIKTLYRKDSGGSFVALPISRAHVYKRFVIAHPTGYTTFEEAVALREQVVYADRNDLPLEPGAHFVADLIGMPVLNFHTKQQYGTLHNVTNRGASDLYEVETPNGIVYVPVVAEFVAEITETAILLTPIPGMFEGAEEA